MIRNITQNELLLLAYNELPPGRHKEVSIRVAQDKELSKELLAIKRDMMILDTVDLKPNPTSVQIIMEESCSSSSMEMI